MAGTLTISTLSDGTNSTSATNCIQGSAKAWVNFNGTGTVAIRASYNVSSITDNGTGLYTVNFTNALADADYVGVFGCNDNGNTTTMNYRSGGTKTASAFQVSTVADGANLTDNNTAMVAVFR